MSAAKVSSASAIIEAAVVIASVPSLSSGAENSIAPSTSPSATVVSLVCSLRIAPSEVLAVMSPDASLNTAFSAGSVQKITFVPEPQFTALSLLLDCSIVVRAKVVPLAV